MNCEICQGTIGVKSYSFHKKLQESQNQFGAVHTTTKTYSGIPTSISICQECILKAIKNDIKSSFGNMLLGLIFVAFLSILYFFFGWDSNNEIIPIILLIIISICLFWAAYGLVSGIVYKMKSKNKTTKESDGINLAGNWYFDKEISIMKRKDEFVSPETFNKLKK